MDGATVFLIWLLLAGFIGGIANHRGRSFWAFFFLSVLLSPVLGLVVVLVMSDLKAEAEKERGRERQHERELESLRTIASQSRVPSPTPVPPDRLTSSVADELTKLAQLRDQGVLTQQEFDVQKARLLAG